MGLFSGVAKGVGTAAKKAGTIIAKNPKFVVGGVGAAIFLPRLLGLGGPSLPGPLGTAADALGKLGELVDWVLNNPQEAAAGGLGVMIVLHYL